MIECGYGQEVITPSVPSIPAFVQVGKEKDGSKAQPYTDFVFSLRFLPPIFGSATARVKIQDVNFFQRIIEWLMNIMVVSKLLFISIGTVMPRVIAHLRSRVAVALGAGRGRGAEGWLHYVLTDCWPLPLFSDQLFIVLFFLFCQSQNIIMLIIT